MVFERRKNWTDAQWDVFNYWSQQAALRPKSEKVLTQAAKDRGTKRRRIERIEESRARWADIKEVWQ